jgi:hypothetical protein
MKNQIKLGIAALVLTLFSAAVLVVPKNAFSGGGVGKNIGYN